MDGELHQHGPQQVCDMFNVAARWDDLAFSSPARCVVPSCAELIDGVVCCCAGHRINAVIVGYSEVKVDAFGIDSNLPGWDIKTMEMLSGFGFLANLFRQTRVSGDSAYLDS